MRAEAVSVLALRTLRTLRCYMLYVACVALDGNQDPIHGNCRKIYLMICLWAIATTQKLRYPKWIIRRILSEFTEVRTCIK